MNLKLQSNVDRSEAERVYRKKKNCTVHTIGTQI